MEFQSSEKKPVSEKKKIASALNAEKARQAKARKKAAQKEVDLAPDNEDDEPILLITTKSKKIKSEEIPQATLSMESVQNELRSVRAELENLKLMKEAKKQAKKELKEKAMQGKAEILPQKQEVSSVQRMNPASSSLARKIINF